MWFFATAVGRMIGVDVDTGEVVSQLVSDRRHSSPTVENADLASFNRCVEATVRGCPYQADTDDRANFSTAAGFLATITSIDSMAFDSAGLWSSVYLAIARGERSTPGMKPAAP